MKNMSISGMQPVEYLTRYSHDFTSLLETTPVLSTQLSMHADVERLRSMMLLLHSNPLRQSLCASVGIHGWQHEHYDEH